MESDKKGKIRISPKFCREDLDCVLIQTPLCNCRWPRGICRWKPPRQRIVQSTRSNSPVQWKELLKIKILSKPKNTSAWPSTAAVVTEPLPIERHYKSTFSVNTRIPVQNQKNVTYVQKRLLASRPCWDISKLIKEFTRTRADSVKKAFQRKNTWLGMRLSFIQEKNCSSAMFVPRPSHTSVISLNIPKLCIQNIEY